MEKMFLAIRFLSPPVSHLTRQFLIRPSLFNPIQKRNVIFYIPFIIKIVLLKLFFFCLKNNSSQVVLFLLDQVWFFHVEASQAHLNCKNLSLCFFFFFSLYIQFNIVIIVIKRTEDLYRKFADRTMDQLEDQLNEIDNLDKEIPGFDLQYSVRIFHKYSLNKFESYCNRMESLL